MLTAQGEQGSLFRSSSSRKGCSHHPHHLPSTWERRLGLWVVSLAFSAPRPATADLLSSLEDLELSNRRLAGENAKLQRSVETAEEGSARLGEEITALRKQLRRWAGPHPPSRPRVHLSLLDHSSSPPLLSLCPSCSCL